MPWIDYWYVILVLPAVLVAVFAQYQVQHTFSRYSRVPVRAGLSGAEMSVQIQRANGLSVPVEATAGSLTDHYDPRTGVIRLSEPVYGACSVAAVGVAAHETGHALQYAEGYFPVRVRAAIIPTTRFASAAAPYLIALGLIFSFQPLAMAGVLVFGLSVLFQLVTLPVEFNASRRALHALEGSGELTAEELAGVRRVLTAAAMTYVAALLVSLMHFLRLLLIVAGRGRRNRR